MKVGFLGLGVMGSGMAARILDAGHTLTVFNRTPERATPLLESGARLARTPRGAAEGAEVVVIMVSNDAAVREVCEGPDGLLQALEPRAIVLQMSTIGPDTTRWLAERVEAQGGRMIDAPVMGSRPEATEGKLWVLASAEASVLEDARPVLDAVSQTVYHVGAIGQGTILKLCNNLVGGGVVAAVAEGIALLDAAGIDPSLYIRVISESNLPNRLWIGKATLMVQNDFAPRFSIENMAKDLDLAVQLGRSLGLDLEQGAQSRRTLLRGAAVVGGDKDMAAAVEGVRQTV
jgi:3-hydroxyisobutyrate dehydrogenase-like beta-hydroxyacid dehydrogenase